MPLPEPEEEASLQDVERNNLSHSVCVAPLTVCNFADVGYLFARSAAALSYTTTVVAHTLCRRNQHLASDKREVLACPLRICPHMGHRRKAAI